jgi:hypothetical protein
VAGHLAENTASKVIGMVPALASGSWTVEIKTQYTVGGTFLKEPPTIKSAFALTVANGKLVARAFKKHDFYRFLEENGIKWEKIISKKLLPDDALLVIVRETLFIIEVKYQQVSGSVDEKLQTCDFKRKQYLKLVRSLELKVEYVYVLNDWFKDPSYKDVLDYINSVNFHYKFNELPLAWLGLPTGKNT